MKIWDGIVYILRELGFMEKSQESSLQEIQYYWDLEEEIFDQCFDERTLVFNWKKWHARRDEIIHTAPANVLEDIDGSFRHFGCKQIYLINAMIESHILGSHPYDPEPGMRMLKREVVDTEILRGLPSMFSISKGNYTPEICPANVLKYQKLLSGVVYRSPGTVARSEFEAIVSLGRIITS